MDYAIRIRAEVNYDLYYDVNASQRAVLREVYRGFRPEVRRNPALRDVRHDLYREVLTRRELMFQLMKTRH